MPLLPEKRGKGEQVHRNSDDSKEEGGGRRPKRRPLVKSVCGGADSQLKGGNEENYSLVKAKEKVGPGECLLVSLIKKRKLEGKEAPRGL